jgi:hypothetical protein
MRSPTTADLLEAIKQRGMIPDNQTTWSDSRLLTTATEDMRAAIVPLLMSVREEYFVMSKDISVVIGTSRYAIPERSAGQGVREVLWIDSEGNIKSMPQLTVEDGEVAPGSNFENGVPYAYRIEWDAIVLSPAVTSTGTMRVLYVVSPGDMISTDDAAQITGIDTATNTVSASTVPATWVGTEVVDVIRGSAGCEYLALGATITGITGTNITLSALPADLAIGDWVALEGKSPVPQLPRDLVPLLAHKVVVTVLESMNQRSAADAAEARYQKLMTSALTMISPRVKGGAKKLVSRSYF